MGEMRQVESGWTVVAAWPTPKEKTLYHMTRSDLGGHLNQCRQATPCAPRALGQTAAEPHGTKPDKYKVPRESCSPDVTRLIVQPDRYTQATPETRGG